MKQKITILSIMLGFFVIAILTVENGSFWIVIAAIGGLSAYFIPVLVTKRKENLRNRSYDLDLPDFMVHTAMFIEAGLILWDALERAAGAGNRERPLYQDINGAFDRVRKGSSKDLIAVFEELAAQRKSASLSNFCAMVTQNVRKGSGELSMLFTAQAQLYRNERRRVAEKLAEEAVTLLLIPSSIVLIALVLLLLAPAVMQIFGEI